MEANNHRNLVPFWSVQCSSQIVVFSSEEEAENLHKKWEKEVYEEYREWENSNSGYAPGVEFTLEADLFGGCYQSYHLNLSVLPSTKYYPTGSQSRWGWEGTPGVDKIKWGNLATARPSR